MSCTLIETLRSQEVVVQNTTERLDIDIFDGPHGIAAIADLDGLEQPVERRNQQDEPVHWQDQSGHWYAADE